MSIAFFRNLLYSTPSLSNSPTGEVIMPKQNRRALFIGINNYPGGNALNGCIPDIMLSAKVLNEKFGYSDIKLLRDSEATKKRIIQEIKNLFYGAKGGGIQRRVVNVA